jgi:thiamine biosynthesis lipoprotein
MIYVFETMGTVVSLEPPLKVPEVEAIFAAYDERFSLYRPTSELSQVRDGKPLHDSSQQLRDAYALALDWREKTGGAFTPHRPDGIIDLSGIVKALAMDAAGRVLRDKSNWLLNAGGDVLASGPGASVGIADPSDRLGLLTSVMLDNERRAVATSGIAERGDHIWGRGTFAQVTVVADDIITADVLATAIMAGGWDTLNLATDGWDVDVLAIDRAGNLAATPGMRTLVAA